MKLGCTAAGGGAFSSASSGTGVFNTQLPSSIAPIPIATCMTCYPFFSPAIAGDSRYGRTLPNPPIEVYRREAFLAIAVTPLGSLPPARAFAP